MKRHIVCKPLCGPTTTAELIIDKNGLRVEGKTPVYKSDDSFIESFISRCVDMDSWKFTAGTTAFIVGSIMAIWYFARFCIQLIPDIIRLSYGILESIKQKEQDH